MKTIHTLIVDDELPAQQRIQRLLEADDQFHVTGVCVNGKEALEFLTRHPIDLLLLDIEMPVMSGFSLLEKLDPDNRPLVVFITAYNEYAITAFEYFAIDYLLKPFTNDRFKKMLARIIDQFKNKEAAGVPWADVNDSMAQRKLPGNRIAVKTGKKYSFIEPVKIDYVLADGNYCTIKLRTGEKFVHRETLSNLLLMLPADTFVRIHHSCIISVYAVKQVNRLVYGEMEVCMDDGCVLKVSRKYKDVVKKMIRK